MNHAMLDLETLSTEVHYHPTVLSIGISSTSGLEFYTELPTAAQVGRHRSPSALAWWAGQGDNLPERCAGIPRSTMRTKLLACALILSKCDYIWSNGAGFDIPILKDIFAEHSIAWPVKYNADRCYRTLLPLATREGAGRSVVTHNALEDAKAQLEILNDYFTLKEFENV